MASSSVLGRARWSNSRESWQERGAALLLLAGAAAAWRWGGRLSGAQQVLLWGLLLLSLAGVLRRGWVKLFGPVLFYELVGIARRGRYYLLRTAYASLLGVLLCLIYLSWFPKTFEGENTVRVSEMAEFAGSFFATFLGVQFATVALLTPAYTAGAIAEEKDRKTLEFLLATDLRNREIVLSKLLARLLNLGVIILTGLPVLGFLQFLGGVDPDLVIAGFAATGVTMISLASLSILCSVVARKPRDAIVYTYLLSLTYLCLSGATWLLLIPDLGIADFPSTTDWNSPVNVRDLVEWVSAGNIVAVLTNWTANAAASGPDLTEVPAMLRNYALFHGLLALVCAGWAVKNVRAVALKEGAVPQGAKGEKRRWLRRPAVGQRPMVWKELFVETGTRYGWFLRVAVGLLVLVSFLPAGIILFFFIARVFRDGQLPSNGLDEMSMEMNVWARIVGTLVACLLLLGVAVRAAGSVSGERDKQTFDSLLTSPLDSDAILYAKWLGSIFSVRWSWLWLGGVGALAVLTRGIHVLAVPLLLGAWFVYAAFLAVLGLWFSTVSRTTLRATLYTVLAAAAVGFGHWLVWSCCIPFFIFSNFNGGDGFEWVMEFQAFGLTPPLTLGFLAFHGEEFQRFDFASRNEAWEMLGCCLVGLFGYAVATGCLLGVAGHRFREVTGRVPGRRPGPPPEGAGLPIPDVVPADAGEQAPRPADPGTSPPEPAT